MMKKAWWKEAIVYQIYPRSFMDSNGDGIGDIPGIISKLDYLKELGIDVVWLCPCFKSPNDDNGYDISDYRDIMDEFGTMDDFKELLKQTHERGMKLLLDLVVNHSSDEHPWFVESRKSKDNPYRDYYIWRDGKDGKEPNNWTSYFYGPACKYDEATDQYYLHIFSTKQPDLNWENPTVRHEIYDMMKFWLDMGCDGFRMDTVNIYSKTPGLPDGKPGENIGEEYFQDGPRIHEFLQEMNREVLSKYDIMTVGELTGGCIEESLQYANNEGTELGMVFQSEQNLMDCGDKRFSYRKVPLSELKVCFSKWQTYFQGRAWNSLYWTNHDQPRTVSRRGNDKEYRKESQKMLYTMLLTMQGTPYIYQEEEIGMTNVYFDNIEDYDDVEIRSYWDRYVVHGDEDPEKTLDGIHYRARDNARTPMQWDDSENAGFTTGTPWLKVNPNYKEINIKEALEDENSIFHYMQRLIRTRKENEVAVYGDFIEYEPENEELYLYERNFEGKKLFVVLNFTENHAQFHLPEAIDPEGSRLLISNYDETPELQSRKLRPYEAAVYLWEK